jgi:hypothetical protein
MNKTIEAVKNGQKVATDELFEVVNAYVLTTLKLSTKDNDDVISMQVNQFERLHDDYKFSQKCTGYNSAMYILKKDDCVSVVAEYNDKADALYITCKLKNSMELSLYVINVMNSEEDIESEGFYETDVYTIHDFLNEVIHEENEYYCSFARITDVFGLDLKMHNPFRTFVDTLDDSDWKLRISDDFSTVEVPVVDDGVNLFYMEETDYSKEIIVKPYGQPFMEIRMLFFKKHEENEESEKK